MLMSSPPPPKLPNNNYYYSHNFTTLRRSPRLMDHFKKLPDDLTFIIFSKLKDPKTLLRCSAVSKHFSSLVSDSTRSLTLRISYPPDVPCSPHHHHHHPHIPLSAIPALMKLFRNLKHLAIKICLAAGRGSSSSPVSRRLEEHLHDGDMCMLNVVWCRPHIRVMISEACEIGMLSSSASSRWLRMKPRRFHPWAMEMNSFFFHRVYPHCPKNMQRLVVSGAKVHRAVSGGKVFMEAEQLNRLAFMSPRAVVSRGWLNREGNVVYWLHKNANDDSKLEKLREQVLLTHCQERLLRDGHITLRHLDRRFVTQTDVKEMLSAFDSDEGDY
ncbi:hypothetical protein Tsubulata_011106 [Turnera subulata]|uniref:F-box domain-containing protein n=1 Tax=Turnera subulata TaxID=218843 RepID=A0A9Q0GBH4_9ROSI|nr:hypothetical protein Tsubulata_011106 [Turnera subulata]